MAKSGGASASRGSDNRKVVAENRRARFNYELLEHFEAGLELLGTEVKSLRQNRGNIQEAYASPEAGGLFLINSYIPEYKLGNRFNHEPRRRRRLLLHKREIERLAGAVAREGLTIVPLKLYFNARGIAKLELALARGKKLHDKRETEKKRDWERDRARLMRERG